MPTVRRNLGADGGFIKFVGATSPPVASSQKPLFSISHSPFLFHVFRLKFSPPSYFMMFFHSMLSIYILILKIDFYEAFQKQACRLEVHLASFFDF